MYKPNPKQIDSNLIDCTPQKGPCPRNCNQCFYNRDDKLWWPNKPTAGMADGKIVRMNALHDSNVKRYLVLRAAKKYKHVFFNTAIPKFDFPGPVVYTANSDEERPVDMRFLQQPIDNLMFVRLRVSSTNLIHVKKASGIIFNYSSVLIVLTFMRYYDCGPPSFEYLLKMHISNRYWCPTRGFKRAVLKEFKQMFGRRVTMCGSLDSNYCKDCRNCETFYWLTLKHMREKNDSKTK